MGPYEHIDHVKQMAGEVSFEQLYRYSSPEALVLEGFCPRTFAKLNPQGACPCNTKWQARSHPQAIVAETRVEGNHTITTIHDIPPRPTIGGMQ